MNAKIQLKNGKTGTFGVFFSTLEACDKSRRIKISATSCIPINWIKRDCSGIVKIY